MFMPCSTEWNSGEIVFSIDQAVDWQKRAMAAGGAYVHAHTYAHIARRYYHFGYYTVVTILLKALPPVVVVVEHFNRTTQLNYAADSTKYLSQEECYR